MPIDLACPGCGKKLRLSDEHAGKTGRCPACQATFQIPAGAQPPAPLPSPPPIPTPTFGEWIEPSPFAEPKPEAFVSTNPYASPAGATMYSAPPHGQGEGFGIASIILGVVSILSALFSLCCCLGWIITFPTGIIGLVLAFQAPPQQRLIGIVLNSAGMGLIVLSFLATLAMGLFQSLQ